MIFLSISFCKDSRTAKLSLCSLFQLIIPICFIQHWGAEPRGRNTILKESSPFSNLTSLFELKSLASFGLRDGRIISFIEVACGIIYENLALCYRVMIIVLLGTRRFKK